MRRLIAALAFVLTFAPALAQNGLPGAPGAQVPNSPGGSGGSTNLAGLGSGVWGVSTTANGNGYAPGDSYTPSIPGATANSILSGAYNNAVLYVATTQVVSATVAAGGSACTGTTATLTGTTGTGGSGAFFTATAPVSGGAIQSPVTITSGGSYRTNPTSISAEPVTGSSCSGAQLTLVMGVQFANVQNPGSYSAIAGASASVTQSATSGAGAGATFTLTFAPYGLLIPPTNSPNFGAQNVNQAAYNFCAGYLCLNANTSGVENTAFGWSALAFDTTGSYNTGFGVHALGAALTTGSNNTGVGVDAGRNLTTGNSNTFVGLSAGLNSAAAFSNTVVGSGAMTAATTSIQNTVVGTSAGNNLTGSNNTVVGFNSGGKISSGASNIAIGPTVATVTLTTGNHNVLIGTSSAVDTVASNTSNEINIENLLFFNSASTAAPALSACGTGSPTVDTHGNNRSGTITAGAGTLASCLMTFAGSGYATWNHCRVTSQSAVASFAYSYTLTTLTVTGTSITSDKFDYDCDGL
jgi:hypothetical protein